MSRTGKIARLARKVGEEIHRPLRDEYYRNEPIDTSRVDPVGAKVEILGNPVKSDQIRLNPI